MMASLNLAHGLQTIQTGQYNKTFQAIIKALL